MGLSGLPCTLVTPRTAFGCFEQLVLTNGAYCREAQGQEHASTDEAQTHQVRRQHCQVLHDIF